MQIKALCGALGSEVQDINLAAVDSNEMGVIRDTFHQSHVLVFPDQDLEPAAQVAFTDKLLDVLGG